jgi:hypothetical protein
VAKVGKIKVCFYIANQARSITMDNVPHQEFTALDPVPEKALVENSVSHQAGHADNLPTLEKFFRELISK